MTPALMTIAKQSKAFFTLENSAEHSSCGGKELTPTGKLRVHSSPSPYPFALLQECKRTPGLPYRRSEQIWRPVWQEAALLTRAQLWADKSCAGPYSCGTDPVALGDRASPEEAEQHKGCSVAQFLPPHLGSVPSTGEPRGCLPSPSLPPLCSSCALQHPN